MRGGCLPILVVIVLAVLWGAMDDEDEPLDTPPSPRETCLESWREIAVSYNRYRERLGVRPVEGLPYISMDDVAGYLVAAAPGQCTFDFTVGTRLMFVQDDQHDWVWHVRPVK